MRLDMGGALTPDQVAEVPDDGNALRAAANRLASALDDLAADTQRSSQVWSLLSLAVQGDALTPALAPLMAPANSLAAHLAGAGQQFARIAGAATSQLAHLSGEHDSLVRQIDEFHRSAAGQAEAHIAQQAAHGLLGGLLAEFVSWRQIPALAYDEMALRWKVSTHNEAVASTLASIASQISGIDVRSNVKLPDIRSPRAAVRLLNDGILPSAVAALTGQRVDELLIGMSKDEVTNALRGDALLRDWVKDLSPAEAAKWWNALGADEQDGALVAIPVIIGTLDGIPAMARVAANKINARNAMPAAQKQIEKLEQELADARKQWALDSGAVLVKQDLISKLKTELKVAKDEVKFLKSATGDNPTVQLYLFDPAHSRIIQMIGTPSAATTHVITYVPGTFASMGSFYNNDAQQIAQREVSGSPQDTVAFVYKDGLFPGEDDARSAANPWRVGEANDVKVALTAGVKLAAFQSGLSASDPELAHASTVGIGHSWGLADLTSSEVAGAHYDQVISLSGAGMVPQWKPDASTQYTDFSYYDILQQAQQLPGHPIWGGNVPRNSPAFQHDEYYVNPDAYTGANPMKTEGQLLANHNLIATTSAGNSGVLRALEKAILE